MNLLVNSQTNVSLIKDPFKSEKISYIDINCFTQFKDPYWDGQIRFKNGMTEGTQRFKVMGTENLHLLLKQMQDFVNSLE